MEPTDKLAAGRADRLRPTWPDRPESVGATALAPGVPPTDDPLPSRPAVRRLELVPARPGARADRPADRDGGGAVEPAPTGAVTVRLHRCPPGMDADTLAPEAAFAVTDPLRFDVGLVTPDGAALLTLAEAEVGDGSYTFAHLPSGRYGIGHPQGVAGTDFLVVGAERDRRDGSDSVVLDGDAPSRTIDVYVFGDG